jgi:hypothetical protein
MTFSTNVSGPANSLPVWSHLSGGDATVGVATYQAGSAPPSLTPTNVSVQNLILSGDYMAAKGSSVQMISRADFMFSLGADVQSVSISDLVIPVVSEGQGHYGPPTTGWPQPVTITAVVLANSPAAHDIANWWQDILQGNFQPQTLVLEAAQGMLHYEFRDCIPTRLSLAASPPDVNDVLDLTCLFDSVSGGERMQFLAWLNAALHRDSTALRDLSIDASSLTGDPLFAKDYTDVLISGYRFPSFDKGDAHSPASDAMRFFAAGMVSH